jgi:signal transduction histidine kinase
MLPSLWRIARTGVLAALAVAAIGWGLERARHGASEADAVARIEGELRGQFEQSVESVHRMVDQVVAVRLAVPAAARDQGSIRSLFEGVDAAVPRESAGRTGVTVYDENAVPLAWAGRTSELPKSRIDGPDTIFLAPSAVGPRLVQVRAILDPDRPAKPRLGTVVGEQQLGPVRGAPGLSDTVILPTSLAPVSLRVRVGDSLRPPSPGAYALVVPSFPGGPLVDAEVAASDLLAMRARWLGATRAAVLGVLGVTMLFCCGPLIEWRRRVRTSAAFIRATAVLIGVLVTTRIVCWYALSAILGPRSLASPFDLLLDGLAAVAIVWIAVDSLDRGRAIGRRPRSSHGSVFRQVWYGVALFAAGIGTTALIWLYERGLQQIAADTTIDLLQFSLHPWTAPRIALASGLVLLHAGAIWAAALVTSFAGLLRTTRRSPFLVWVAWLLGVGLGAALVRSAPTPVELGPLLVATAAAGAGAVALSQFRRRARHASQTARLSAVFLALLGPAVVMYPSLVALTTTAKESLVATTYAPQAARQREDLQSALTRALSDIDAQSSLPDLTARPIDGTPTADRAFAVWSATDLATYRRTSAIELYGPEGGLISRFATPNLPEYSVSRHDSTGCNWEVPLDEVLPSGSSQRHVLRTSRGVCRNGRMVGSVVVSVMLDYRTLPFIEARSPYLASLEPDAPPQPEGTFGRDIELAVYGWSRAPTVVFGTSVWQLSDAVFQRLVESRTPFWTAIRRDNVMFRVYFVSDRGGVYALGYPTLTWVEHLVGLAELMFLTGAIYVALLLMATLVNAVAHRPPASGRALFREVRASFYRKLFLSFVATAVIPIVILAFATHTYLVAQLGAGVQQRAAQTALVAQRLVEDYATLQQQGASALSALDDQIMVLIRRAIDEDVNLFERTQLQATSQRELFASGLLPARTPGDAYRRIVLDRLPTFVGQEEVGDIPYLLAAAPVRVGSRERIVAVPVTLGQRETERQIDDLDRQVLSAAVLFSLLGAALGYWMAERIADPINRLTRATQRIARGNLDAHVAAAASDELGRLVRDFNGMAEQLKRQRAELERTQRLEAWADMARQVAHEIKNPLTPIQLSAEHARRVNMDRGRPLSPVLDDCINAILSQVRLLRQIAAEFSSFASSTTPRPEPTQLSDLLEEVIGPYRAGLAGRVDIVLSIAPHLPSLNIDRTLIGRAFTNVVENALHAMPSGGRLSIAACRQDGNAHGLHHVLVEISDSGVGMDTDALARIFEPYFSTKAVGTGLGLTIAKRNVELNGGTIAVRSQKGAGTTVAITLPLSSPPVAS